MARLLYGAAVGDFTSTVDFRPEPLVKVWLWQARTGGSPEQDFVAVFGTKNNDGSLTSDVGANVAAYGPDGYSDSLWVSRSLTGGRVRLTGPMGEGMVSLAQMQSAIANALAALPRDQNPNAVGLDDLPPGSALYAPARSDGSWPARPTSRDDLMVIWVGGKVTPPLVTTGLAGMRATDMVFLVGTSTSNPAPDPTPPDPKPVVTPPAGGGVADPAGLYDTFETQDVARWDNYGIGGNSIYVNAGDCVCLTTANYYKLISKRRWDFTTGSITIQFNQFPNVGNGSTLAAFEINPNDASRISFGVSGGRLYLEQFVDNVRQPDRSTELPTDAKVFRARRDANNIVFETASGPAATFTTRYTLSAAGLALDTVGVRLVSGFYGTETAAGSARFGFVAVTSPTTTKVAPVYTPATQPPVTNPPAAGGGAGGTPGGPSLKNLWNPRKEIRNQKGTYPEIANLDIPGQTQWVTGDYDTGKIAGWKTEANGATMSLTIYAIPGRDNGNYSAGGFPSRDAYINFVRGIRDNIGTYPTVMTLEADALGLGRDLDVAKKAERMETLRQLIALFAGRANFQTYIDASMWVSETEQADLLRQVNVASIRGFAINASNFESLDNCLTYGDNVVNALNNLGIGGKKYIIDTARNGAGNLQRSFPGSATWFDNGRTWCNPPGRRPGKRPGYSDPGHPNFDGALWIKGIGESDGNFPSQGQSNYFNSSAPNAGTFWVQYARDLLGLNPGNGSGSPYQP